MTDLRLLIVAADALARAGLSALVSDLPDIESVGQIGPDELVHAELNELNADVILWDLGWEPEEQIDLLFEIAADSHMGGPAIITLLQDQDQVNSLWSRGIRSMLLRDASIESLRGAVLAAANRLAVIDPSFMEILVPEGLIPDGGLVEDLTPREIEVLVLVAEGMSNKAIASTLSISEHTVKFHLNALMSKLDVQSRTSAVVRATRLGLIAL